MSDETTARSKPSGNDISTTFAKGLRVLKAFETGTAPLTLAEIARLAELDRATSRRLVLTLAHLGYVRQSGRGFTLTPKILLLAGGFLHSRQFTKRVVPVLNQHSKAIGVPIYLAVRDGFDAVYLAHAGLEEGNISYGFSVGSRLPLLQTGIGRALLVSEAPEVARELVADAPLDAYTEHSITDRAEVARLVEEARATGYVYSDGEFEAGVVAVAMPLPRAETMGAAIGMSYARDRFEDGAYLTRVVEALRGCRQSLDGIAERL
ncbi:IclR family transcriptional regulator [Acuticoccus sediminis]|uniref:IclR family transcriptional regulator n=1 Tax=Acuticoccus sediminis TaxID=2184697 RepID=UPI001CFF1C64|nr:IclR family transcriptional regulator C-terminal domain-containing protein [Acuticoccus sediminis]